MSVASARGLAQAYLRESTDTLRAVEERCLDQIVEAADIIVTGLRAGGKLLICGNGGSAADAQHLATEFVSTFTVAKSRNCLFALVGIILK